MIKYAFLPEFKLEVDRLRGIGLVVRPEFSHGSSMKSMCIDMYSVSTAIMSRACDITYKPDEYGTIRQDYIVNNSSSTHPFPSILPYAIINTGVVFELPDGLHLTWGGRSGLMFKGGRLPFEGRIDAPYRGEVKALLYSLNPLDEGAVITAGSKIAQLELVDYRSGEHNYELVEVDFSDIQMETARGVSGFGSTGN